MNQDKSKLIIISYNDVVINKINAEKPNIDELVLKILEINELEKENFKVETIIENFDVELFEEIIHEFIDQIKDLIQINIDEYDNYISLKIEDEISTPYQNE